jgi:hypothetical protein
MPAPTVSAAADSSLEALIPQLVTTPEGHKAVANYYRGKAADATAEANRHREMAKNYAESNYTRKKMMEEHCGRLVSEYDALAKQYQDMANEHEEMAKK